MRWQHGNIACHCHRANNLRTQHIWSLDWRFCKSNIHRQSDFTTEDNQHYLCFINSQVTTAESFNITIKWFSFEIIDWLQFLSSFLQLQSILTGTSKYINFRIKQLQKIHQKCNRKNWTLSAALIITQNFNFATSPNSFYWFLYWMYIVCKAKNVSIFSSEFLYHKLKDYAWHLQNPHNTCMREIKMERKHFPEHSWVYFPVILIKNSISNQSIPKKM